MCCQSNGLFRKSAYHIHAFASKAVLCECADSLLTVTSVNYGLSFFSDSRLSSLSARLQNNKLHDLVKRVSHVLQSRAKPREAVATGSLTRKRENLELFTDSAAASKWIQSESCQLLTAAKRD